MHIKYELTLENSNLTSKIIINNDVIKSLVNNRGGGGGNDWAG